MRLIILRHTGVLGLLMATALLGLCAGCAATAREVVAELVPAPPGAAIELMVSRGRQAENGQYPTTVMIQSGDVNSKSLTVKSNADESCSGVFISRKLVLTAAHCMCLKPILSAANKALNATDCASRVHVFQHRRKVEVARDGSRVIANIFRPVEGSAFFPDKFRVDINEQGHITSVHADVAVISLDREIDIMFDHQPADREFRLYDRITVVGFGSTHPGGTINADAPYFGTNMVTGTRAMDREQQSPPTSSKTPDPDKIRSAADFHEFYEANAELGDSGGPCFREEGGRRWLMGIAVHRVHSVDPIKTRCLDLFTYKPLLDTLIKQATAKTN